MSSNQFSTREKNLALAMSGIACVYKKFPLGPLNRKESLPSMGLTVYLAQMQLFNLLRESYKKEGGQETVNTILFSGKLQSAFCGEMAAAAIHYIKEMDKNNTVELVHIDNHQMVVIGRELASNPNDIATWGKDAVICDPWARIFYEASKFYTIQEKGEKIPVIKSAILS